MNDDIQVLRVETDFQHQMALEVMREVYRDEKHWVGEDEKLVAAADLDNRSITWLVAVLHYRPVGVLRVLYDPPLDLYREYGFRMVDDTLNLEHLLRTSHIAEIGRFAVLPECRRNLRVAMSLMRHAGQETVERGYTHYITDVFEGERHSPYEFHRRVIGFRLVATHDHGELNCPNRRLTMILDIREALQRLRQSRRRVFRRLVGEWEPRAAGLLASPATVAVASA